MEANAAPKSKRVMGIWMALALVMGSMIGSGVFLLPAGLAPLGWNSVFGWLITVAGTLCMATVFARLARSFPHAGGPYAFTRAAFGTGPAFAVAWAYWISLWVGNAAIATAAVSYLSRLIPALGAPGISAVVTVALVWLFTLINLRGAALAARVQLVSTIVKLVPLLAVIALAAWVLMREGTTPVLPFASADINISSIALATTLTLWAMLGIEAATVPADCVRDPERTIPRATLLGTGAAGLIYIFVCSAVVLMLPAAMVAASEAPFADFVDTYWGINAGTAIAAFGSISALGALNGWIMCQAELPAAIARDGLFPSWLAKLSGRGVPVNSHILSSSLLSVVVLLNSTKSMAKLFEFLILLTTSITLVMYLGCALAAARLMVTGEIKRGVGFAFVVIAALVYSIWTVIGAGLEAVLWGLALLAVGVPVYLAMRKVQRGVPSNAASA